MDKRDMYILIGYPHVRWSDLNSSFVCVYLSMSGTLRVRVCVSIPRTRVSARWESDSYVGN